ncbi:MAG: hypothetical protein L0Z62_42450 [Gemmataceae bacterium]|nr:hypothetical protein [Gemmataceae bacterium]
MAMVLCEVRPGAGKVAVSVNVRDITNERTFLSIDRDFVVRKEGQTYLPIGVVYRDREKGVALIELPVEADSGTHRLWVPLASLVDSTEGLA